MSKLGKRLLTTALCTTMLASSSLAVFATEASTPGGPGSSIEGNNTVVDPIYSVTVPTNLNFAVDAFEQKGEGQIVSTDISMTNNSNVAIKMNVSITLSTEKALTFAESAEDVSTETGIKSVFMQAQIADTVTEIKNVEAAYTPGLVVDDDGTYYVSVDVAKEVSGNDSIVVNAAEEMQSVKSVTGTPASTPVVYPLGEEATELDFALAASEYVDYWHDATTEKMQFKTTAENNKSSACYTFTGKVNPNVVWEANDFKATAVYTFMGMTTSDYEAVEYEEGTHALIKKPVAPVDPTFASTAKGVITWSGDAGTGAVSEIVSIVTTIGGSEYDIFSEATGMWSEATVDLENKKITLDSGVATNVGEDVEVTITYKNSETSPAQKTAEITVKLTD